MAGLLLIHGAAHGAWAWRDAIPALEARGHVVHAIDLPSHGEDPTPAAEVTLEAYVEAILAALEGAANRGEPPPLLVGHSMAGYPIALAAARAPARVAGLVYLAAFLPEPGAALYDIRLQALTEPFRAAITRSEDGRTQHYDADAAREVFYHDCPEETVAFARARLCPQPAAPFAAPYPGSQPDLPTFYIRCAGDRAIAPAYQAACAGTLPAGHAFDMECSHSPFFAAPERLADILTAIARELP